MNAIILAAGRGRRLLNLTSDKPKCLVELRGKPLLSCQLEALREAGIQNILVVRGYLKDQILGDFQTRDNPRWAATNMVATLMTAMDWLESNPCIVSYSDIIYPADAVQRLIKATSPLAVLYDPNWLDLWQKRFDDPLCDAESFQLENGMIMDMGRPNVTLDQIQGQYMGLLKFTPESSRWISDLLENKHELCDKLDMTTLLRLLLECGKAIQAISYDGLWCEVDSQRDLQVAQEVFL